MAVHTTQGMPLAQALIDELRRRRIGLPPPATLERLCAVAATRAQRQIHQLLVAPLSPQQRDAIDKMLDLREGSSTSALAWLRQSPGKPSAKSVLAHIERLTAIRNIGLPADIGRDVPFSRVSRIAREGAQTAVYQIEEYEVERRHATMVAILIDTAATITDEILNLHDRLIGPFFTKDKNRYERRFVDDGNTLNEKVLLYAQVGSALIGAKETGSDAFAAIEGALPWERFTASVRDAERLAHAWVTSRNGNFCTLRPMSRWMTLG